MTTTHAARDGLLEQLDAHVREVVRREGVDPQADAGVVRRIAESVVRDHDERSLTGAVAAVPDVDAVVGELVARVSGFGPLQPYLDDPAVEELWINDPSRVFVARNGRHELTNLVLTRAQVQELVERMLKSSGRRIDLSQPFVDAMLPDGHRLHAQYRLGSKSNGGVMESAALYLRLSEDKHGDELGVTRQREDSMTLAASRGYDVVRIDTDNDRSAKGTVARPGFEAMLEAVDAGEVHVVVAWSLDRLTRNRRDTLRLMELGQKHGIVIALVRGSDMDLSTPSGRMVAGILSEIARSEIDIKSDRQVRANRQRAEAGKPHFVSRPYGYTRQGDVCEGEAAVLRDVAERFLTGWSTTELTTWLNAQGIPSAKGGIWSRRVVKEHLLSKRNAGIRVYKGQEYAAQWTAIYDADLHDRITAEWTRRHGTGLRAKSDNRRYLLTGLLFCQCGAKMMGAAHNDRTGLPVRDKYRCVPGNRREGCGNLLRVAVTLDHLVTEAVLYRLDSPEMQAALMQAESRAAEIEPLRAQEARHRDRLEALLDDYTDGTITKPEYVRAKQRVVDALQGVELELGAIYSSEQAQALLSPSVTIREAWEVSPVSWRRKLLGLIVEKIVVNRSHKRTPYVIEGKTYKFDPDAVRIVWKV